MKYRKMKNQGVVAVFKRDRFDRYSNFARIGDGSLGGKGRGLAFIDNMVKRHPEFDEFENARIAIPKQWCFVRMSLMSSWTPTTCIRLHCRMRMMLRF